MKTRCETAPRRRGVVSVFALAVVVLMSGLLLGRAKAIMAVHRQSRQELCHHQAGYLADAGLAMAAEHWKQTGEAWEFTWELPPGTIHETNSARVAITVDGNGQCQVHASYPTNSNLLAQVTRNRGL